MKGIKIALRKLSSFPKKEISIFICRNLPTLSIQLVIKQVNWLSLVCIIFNIIQLSPTESVYCCLFSLFNTNHLIMISFYILYPHYREMTICLANNTLFPSLCFKTTDKPLFYRSMVDNDVPVLPLEKLRLSNASIKRIPQRHIVCQHFFLYTVMHSALTKYVAGSFVFL